MRLLTRILMPLLHPELFAHVYDGQILTTTCQICQIRDKQRQPRVRSDVVLVFASAEGFTLPLFLFSYISRCHFLLGSFVRFSSPPLELDMPAFIQSELLTARLPPQSTVSSIDEFHQSNGQNSNTTV